MNRQQQIEQFAKLSEYMLGRHPDEFGLVPDHDGYIKIKEFVQTVTEINGWGHFRKNYINELMLVHNDPPIEVEDSRIRAKDQSKLLQYIACENPPRLLYICIRQKSYPAIIDNGIRPTAHAKIICCKDPEMAQKIGKRRSPQPILLTIHTKKLLDQGMTFLHAGDLLYLTDFIPPDCFTGPPLSKELTAAKKTVNKPDPIETYRKQSEAGSYHLSLDPAEKKYKGKTKEKNSSWKNNKKRLRREKKNAWPDQ